MSSAQNKIFIKPEDYLKGELSSDVKHELVDGHAYAMAGASKNHERISVNILTEFRNHLKTSPCEPFGSDLKVKVNSNFFYPDVIVVCDDKTDNEYYTESPVIIVEVLSKSTRRTDETIKRLSYVNIPNLQEYVLIEQDIVDIQVMRRSNHWFPSNYFMGDEIHFESIDLTLSVEEIYHRVKNDDVIEYLTQKEAEAQENNSTG